MNDRGRICVEEFPAAFGPGMFLGFYGVIDSYNSCLMAAMVEATMRWVNSLMTKRTRSAHPFLVRSITKSQAQTWSAQSGLAHMRARGAAPAADAGLRGRTLEPMFTAYPAHLAQPDVRADGPHVTEDLAMALGRHAVGQLDDDLANLRRRRAQAWALAVGVHRPADDPAFRPGRRPHQRFDRRG